MVVEGGLNDADRTDGAITRGFERLVRTLRGHELLVVGPPPAPDRARRAGFRVVYEPAAVVCHGDSGGMASPRLRSMLMVNRVRYFRRRHGRTASAAFYGSVLFNEAVRGVLGNKAARTAAVALARPSRRPDELGTSERVLPV